MSDETKCPAQLPSPIAAAAAKGNPMAVAAQVYLEQLVLAANRIAKLEAENDTILCRIAEVEAENEMLQAIVDRLRDAEIDVGAWEDDEDIICLNALPVGATIKKGHQPSRWFPEFKAIILGEAATDAKEQAGG